MHQITVEASVLELCAIVTPDVLDLDTIIGHGMIGEAFEDIHYCRMLLTRHTTEKRHIRDILGRTNFFPVMLMTLL